MAMVALSAQCHHRWAGQHTQSHICRFFFDVFFFLFFEGAVFDDRVGSTPVPGWECKRQPAYRTRCPDAVLLVADERVSGGGPATTLRTALRVLGSLIFATDFIFRRARSSRRDRQASLASYSTRANEL